MKHSNLKTMSIVTALLLFTVGVYTIAAAQDHSKAMSTSAAKSTQMHAAGSATMNAKLIDPLEKAKEKTATVQVTVKGITLIDPALAKERPRPGQGHLHYRVDDGPVIATTSTKLSFHELTPGQHRILVVLSANDHSPLGPQETLTVTIP